VRSSRNSLTHRHHPESVAGTHVHVDAATTAVRKHIQNLGPTMVQRLFPIPPKPLLGATPRHDLSINYDQIVGCHSISGTSPRQILSWIYGESKEKRSGGLVGDHRLFKTTVRNGLHGTPPVSQLP
jgi:hypothetical protein